MYSNIFFLHIDTQMYIVLRKFSVLSKLTKVLYYTFIYILNLHIFVYMLEKLV